MQTSRTQKNAPVKRETRIVQEILAWLKTLKHVYAWRQNSGGAYYGSRYVQFSPPGTPDILACVNGCFVGIECKAKRGKLSGDQLRVSRKITDALGLWVCVRSLQECQEFLHQAFDPLQAVDRYHR